MPEKWERHPLLCISLFLSACGREPSNSDFDIDLAELSLTVIQAEYQRIVSNPDDYIGKTIRVYGSYQSFIANDTGNIVHYIIIVPGDVCCQLGFEFIRTANYKFPEDYPKQNSMILINGTLEKNDASSALRLIINATDITAT